MNSLLGGRRIPRRDVRERKSRTDHILWTPGRELALHQAHLLEELRSAPERKLLEKAGERSRSPGTSRSAERCMRAKGASLGLDDSQAHQTFLHARCHLDHFLLSRMHGRP